MTRAGLFDDLDVALHWHADSKNSAGIRPALANKSAKFRFYGIAAHAAGAPEMGRSALDAVEAMNTMVNMMREHVTDDTRIHYVITKEERHPMWFLILQKCIIIHAIVREMRLSVFLTVL